jgi:hypothetical protein
MPHKGHGYYLLKNFAHFQVRSPAGTRLTPLSPRHHFSDTGLCATATLR